ncbi:hypothetical protein AKL16_08610 [Corynebacterium glutamicum]|nr:hypothetical protein AKL16_08610 [Corynebacterium glutamicum]
MRDLQVRPKRRKGTIKALRSATGGAQSTATVACAVFQTLAIRKTAPNPHNPKVANAQFMGLNQ